MIAPEFFKTRIEPDAMPGGVTAVHTSLHLSGREYVHRHGPPIDEVEKRQKAIAWEAVYGDLERKIAEVERRVIPCLGMDGSYDQVHRAFAELASMVRNPFMGEIRLHPPGEVA